MDLTSGCLLSTSVPIVLDQTTIGMMHGVVTVLLRNSRGKKGAS